MIAQISEIKPHMATFFGGLQIAASVGVWLESIQGIAALITVLISVPTAILALVYCVYQVKMIIKKSKKEVSDGE